MLRITIHNEATKTRFIIEGRLVGPWVDELRKCWRAARLHENCPKLQVDLTSVTLIDSEAKKLLAEMHRNGARLFAVGLMTQAIIEEIIGS
jgi:ABC-type transporter Mla MlaB component